MVEQLSDEQIEELREVFDLYDNFKDGLVLKKNVGKIFNALGQNPSKEDIDKLIAEGEGDDAGNIDFPEFLAFVAKRQKEGLKNKKLLAAELGEAFKIFNRKTKGSLSESELREALNKLGEGIGEKQLDKIVSKAEFDENGGLSEENFIKLIISD